MISAGDLAYALEKSPFLSNFSTFKYCLNWSFITLHCYRLLYLGSILPRRTQRLSEFIWERVRLNWWMWLVTSFSRVILHVYKSITKMPLAQFIGMNIKKKKKNLTVWDNFNSK